MSLHALLLLVAGLCAGMAVRTRPLHAALWLAALVVTPQAGALTIEYSLDRAPAEEDALFPLGNAADDDLRILIVNGAARVAHMTREGIAGGNFLRHRGAAIAAEFHGAEREKSA